MVNPDVGAHAVAFYAEPRFTKDHQSIWIIGRTELMQNTAAVAGPQDLLDLAMLEKHG